MSCCLANLLMQLPCFEFCCFDETNRLEILGCACAAGVGATFGTPFGAVLFSIEVTSMSYMVSNLPMAFFSAVCGSAFITLLGLSDFMMLWNGNDSVSDRIMIHDLMYCIALGVICGLLGTVFVCIVAAVSRLRNYLLRPTLGKKNVARRQLWLVALATLIVCPLVYLDGTNGGRDEDSHAETQMLFAKHALGLPAELVWFAPFKLLVTTLSVTLPLPVGLFTPVFVTGSAIGRIFGELVNANPFLHSTISPWEFAIIGCAAFCTGVTGAVSTTVILFELTGDKQLSVPMGLAILCSYFLSSKLSNNVYDALIATNHTPHLPRLPKGEFFRLASDLMLQGPELPFLALNSSTLRDVQTILASCNLAMIPVCESESTMALIGTVHRSHLARAFILCTSPNQAAHEQGQNDGPSIGNSSSSGEAALSLDTLLEFVVFADSAPKSRVKSRPRIMRTTSPPEWGSSSGISGTNSVQDEAEEVDDPTRIPLDTSTHQILETMHLSKVDLIFRQMKPGQLYVTSGGRLTGIITRKAMRDFLSKFEKKPIENCVELFCGPRFVTHRSQSGYDTQFSMPLELGVSVHEKGGVGLGSGL